VTTAAALRTDRLRPPADALVDVAIAVTALAISLGLLSHGGFGFGDSGHGGLDWTSGLLAGCATVPLVVWRRAPGAVFAATAAASVALGTLDSALELPVGPTVALYLFAASRDDEHPWTPRTTTLVAGLFLAYLAAIATAENGFPGSELFHTGLVWAVAWFAGDRTRLRREQIAELQARAEFAERDAERERQLAAAEVRARIARDLHDAAGHTINAIAVRAGAARLRQDPERSQTALEEIERLARTTAAEIDEIVGSLRERDTNGGEVDTPTGMASLDTLVAQQSAAGLDADIVTRGEPRTLDHAVDQAAYRILQEALTNAARHGTGPAHIELAFGEAALEVTVINPVVGPATARSNGGHGLVGMRERAMLLGGSLDAGRANGSFRVQAVLPYARPRR
jgi:signal transduction histidine kinase